MRKTMNLLHLFLKFYGLVGCLYFERLGKYKSSTFMSGYLNYLIPRWQKEADHRENPRPLAREWE